jgi:enoyl-CoA hydratase/carnithine racemase
MEDRIRLTIEGGVADVRLSRADKLNALDPVMFKAIAETGRRLKDDSSVRAVVLSGEGRGFCAGLDIERMMAAARGEAILPFADLTKRKEIAAQSPEAIRAAKRLLNLAVACDAGTGLAAETAEQRGLLGRPNHVEAVSGNLQNRQPVGHWLQPLLVPIDV